MNELDIDFEFKPPFTGLIVASSGSGKTVLVRHFIQNYWKKIFDYVFIMAPTADFSGDYDTFRAKKPDKHLQVFSAYDEEIINEIIEEQKSIAKRYGKHRLPQILLVIDDAMDLLQGNHNLVKDLYFRGRHINISCVCLVQKLKGISTIMRVNTKLCVFFRCGNSNELDNLLSEFTGKTERPLIEAELREWFRRPWSFVMCDFKTQEFPKRYLLGADKKAERYIKWCE